MTTSQPGGPDGCGVEFMLAEGTDKEHLGMTLLSTDLGM
jgi:hypothetical protein